MQGVLRQPFAPGGAKITERLMLIGITSETVGRVGGFSPILLKNMDRIVRRFYNHILSFPVASRVLSDSDIDAGLVPAQKAHWRDLFSCEFSERYVLNAIRIGEVHYERRVPPYLYIGGYNFFLCEVLRLASGYMRGIDLPDLLADITRLVTLDMDLAISAYTRRHWKQE